MDSNSLYELGLVFSKVVWEFGMQQSKVNYSIFYHSSNSLHIYLIVYVDDMVITGSGHRGIE